VLVQRLERSAEDVPVQLLADQRQIDQLDERRLQLAPDLFALMVTEGRQVCALGDRCHDSSFLRGSVLPNERCGRIFLLPDSARQNRCKKEGEHADGD
jgi:hypothetical protein